MNTQYEKNSVYLACASYRMERRKRALREKITIFLAGLCGVCAFLAVILPVVS